jgi:hypothetical protein
MPIDSEHPEYSVYKSIWSKTEDFYAGEEKIKAEGVTYLPALTDSQGLTAYNAYKDRTLFYDATFRTVQGLTGLATWKAPIIKLPKAMEELLAPEQIKGTIREVMKTGRQGLLVDRNDKGDDPYIVQYGATDIINWREDEEGLVLLVLREQTYEPAESDPYQMELITRYRELLIEEGKYQVRIWKQINKEDTTEWIIEEEIFPQKLGSGLDYIPFVFIGAEESGDSDISKPPLLGVVNGNLFHYRLSADYAHGLHWTALPTPWVSGATNMDKETKLEIGSGAAWLLPEASCRAGYLEFTGQGLDPISKALKETEGIMAALGARLLEKQRSGVEAAETARIRQSGEMSILGSLVTSVGAAYEQAGKYMADWMNLNENDVAIEMNVDFIKDKMSPQLLTALVQSYQSGGMSLQTFVYNMEAGEMLSPDTTAEEEMDRIESIGPDVIKQEVVEKEEVEEDEEE